MVIFMKMKKRMKISKGGQVSIPAPIRKRWATTTVTLEDRGEEIVLKPAPDDPLEAAAGAFAGEARGPDLDTVRREEREAEREIEERKYGP
jgi:bifunctional DNA-binding transcriptional regulator/antitoxin component of YhaV-PrlF toxin-antitoxin module